MKFSFLNKKKTKILSGLPPTCQTKKIY